jgi:hypothetical protein
MGAVPVASKARPRGATRLGIWVVALGLLLSLTAPNLALAHPDLDRAIRLSGELEFNQALRAFQKALDSGRLTRGELARLLAERALLLHALRRQGEVAADFRWLAAIDPSYKLDQRAPPDLTQIWESVRREAGGASVIELRDDSGPGMLRLRPVVKGAHPEGLRIDAYFRVDEGPFEPLDEALGVERRYPSGADVQAYARLEGLGRVELSSAGSQENPLAFRVPAASEAGVASMSPDDGAPPSDGKRRIDKKWIWIGGAAAAVVTIVVVAAVVAGGGESSDDVRLRPVANF